MSKKRLDRIDKVLDILREHEAEILELGPEAALEFAGGMTSRDSITALINGQPCRALGRDWHYEGHGIIIGIKAR